MQGYIRHEQNPVPGTLGNKVQSGDFLIYGEPATLEEAKRECQAEDYQLVIIDSPAKLHEVEEALMKDSNYNTISDKFWTGGYLNLSSIGKIASRDFEWHDGSSKKITTHSTELFKQFSSLKALAEHIETGHQNLSPQLGGYGRPVTNCSTLSATDWKSNKVSGVISSGSFTFGA